MMSVKKISALIATPLIALSLSACSLNANNDGPDPIVTAQPQYSDSSEPSEEPSFDEPSSPEETTTSETQDSDDFDTDGLDSGSKPSRDEVKAGLKKIFEDEGYSQRLSSQFGATEEQIEAFYGCVVDTFYDDLSAETLTEIANGNDAAPTEEEQDALFNAGQACRQQLGLEASKDNAG